MLCSKCFEKINQGEEIQTKDSAVICKECAKKPIAYCFTCYPAKPLYYDDMVCKSSRNWSKKINIWWLFSSNSSGSEKVNQCAQCYWKWRVGEEKWEIYSKMFIIATPIPLLSVLFWILHVIYPSKITNFFQEHKSYCILSLLIPLFCFIAYIVGFIILFPNRYKIGFKKKK